MKASMMSSNEIKAYKAGLEHGKRYGVPEAEQNIKLFLRLEDLPVDEFTMKAFCSGAADGFLMREEMK